MKTAFAYATRFLAFLFIGLLLCLLIDAGKEAQRWYTWLDLHLPGDDVEGAPFWRDRK